jgi:fatty acid desaturase
VIVACVAAWQALQLWWLLPIAWILIGSRQHAIAVLMHETVHQRLAKSWPASQVVGRLCAWSIFISWSSFKRNHLGHHKHLNSDDDPDLQFKRREAPNDWIFPKSPSQLALLMTKDLYGYGFIGLTGQLRRYQDKQPASVQVKPQADPVVWRLSFTGAFIGLWLLLVGWQSFLLLWLVPIFTTLPFMLRFRSISEHFHLDDDLEEKTRTVRASWFEREVLGFGPHMIGYHTPHHRYPGVPCHNLKRLDRLLGGAIDDRACIDGYVLGKRTLVSQLLRPQWQAVDQVRPPQAPLAPDLR